MVGIPLAQPAVPTRAVTPPVLAATPIPSTAEDVLLGAIARLQSAPELAPERGSSSQGWSLQSDAGTPSSSSAIQPQHVELEWRDDLSGEYTATAGEGAAVTVVSHEVFGPGDAPVLLADPPPADPAELRDYLSAASGSSPATAGELVSAARVLLSEWRPGPQVHAALLALLHQESADLEVVGAVTDRLGRAATALRANDPAVPHVETLLLLSRDTGAVIALETVSREGLEDVGLEPPVVTAYIAWM